MAGSGIDWRWVEMEVKYGYASAVAEADRIVRAAGAAAVAEMVSEVEAFMAYSAEAAVSVAAWKEKVGIS